MSTENIYFVSELSLAKYVFILKLNSWTTPSLEKLSNGDQSQKNLNVIPIWIIIIYLNCVIKIENKKQRNWNWILGFLTQYIL